MEVSVLTIFTLVFGFVITTWAWKLVNWVWLRPKRLERCLRQQGFKGNSYRLLFGDLKEVWQMYKEAWSKPINLDDDITNRVSPILFQTLKKFGKKSFIWIGPTPRLIIMNPEELKDIFTKLGEFPKPHLSPVIRSIATGLASYEGEKWVKHRKIINPAYHMEKLKLMLPEFYLSFIETLNKWESLASDGHGSCELDVWPDIQNMIGDAISRTAFGSSYEEGKRIFELQKELAKIVMKSLITVQIPGWSYLPTKSNKRIKKVNNELQGLLTDLVQKREREILTGDSEAPNNDLLGILMESNQKEIKEHGNNKGVGMSIGEVIEECKLFYFAGHDNTSGLLAWTMVLLSRFPNWQAQAREEVLKVFGNNNPDYDGLMHLKVVTMILNEVLRLYPPILIIGRETVHEETKLGNLSLPAGVQVTMPAILVHYDTQLWGDDAKEFKPERFAEGVSRAAKGKVSFIPFSWGPRICIGQNFAMIEIKIVLAMILQRFTFELSPSYTHAPISIIALEPQHGAHLILRKR